MLYRGEALGPPYINNPIQGTTPDLDIFGRRHARPLDAASGGPTLQKMGVVRQKKQKRAPRAGTRVMDAYLKFPLVSSV